MERTTCVESDFRLAAAAAAATQTYAWQTCQWSSVSELCRFEVARRFSETAPPSGSTDAIYITNVDGRRNNSPLLLGLIDYLEKTSASNVGFFQPVAESPYPHSTTGLPRHVELYVACSTSSPLALGRVHGLFSSQQKA